MVDFRKGDIVNITGGRYVGDWGRVKKITQSKVKVYLHGNDDTHYVMKKHCKQMDAFAEATSLCLKLNHAGASLDDIKTLTKHMLDMFAEMARDEDRKRAKKGKSSAMMTE